VALLTGIPPIGIKTFFVQETAAGFVRRPATNDRAGASSI